MSSTSNTPVSPLTPEEVVRQLRAMRENANLLPHLDAMNRAFRAAKRRAAKAEPEPKPQSP